MHYTIPTHAANIVKRDENYHLLMLLDGQWMETGITAERFPEIVDIADRDFSLVYFDAPLTLIPPPRAQAA